MAEEYEEFGDEDALASLVPAQGEKREADGCPDDEPGTKRSKAGAQRWSFPDRALNFADAKLLRENPRYYRNAKLDKHDPLNPEKNTHFCRYVTRVYKEGTYRYQTIHAVPADGTIPADDVKRVPSALFMLPPLAYTGNMTEGGTLKRELDKFPGQYPQTTKQWKDLRPRRYLQAKGHVYDREKDTLQADGTRAPAPLASSEPGANGRDRYFMDTLAFCDRLSDWAAAHALASKALTLKQHVKKCKVTLEDGTSASFYKCAWTDLTDASREKIIGMVRDDVVDTAFDSEHPEGAPLRRTLYMQQAEERGKASKEYTLSPHQESLYLSAPVGFFKEKGSDSKFAHREIPPEVVEHVPVLGRLQKTVEEDGGRFDYKHTPVDAIRLKSANVYGDSPGQEQVPVDLAERERLLRDGAVCIATISVEYIIGGPKGLHCVKRTPLHAATIVGDFSVPLAAGAEKLVAGPGESFY